MVNGEVWHMVSRIPNKFAVVGKYLELLNHKGWENHWQVMGVGRELFEEKLCIDANHNSKKFKRRTDIPRNSTEKLDSFKAGV